MKTVQGGIYNQITIRKGIKYQKILKSKRHKRMLTDIDEQEIYVTIFSDQGTLKEAFSCIEEHRAEKLNILNGVGKILAYIKGINFPNVKYLNLRNSNINSVETLPKIGLPQLQTLLFDENDVCNLGPLRKANFPNLSRLDIHHNEFIECAQLARANFPKLQELLLEEENQEGPQNLNSLLKLNAEQVKQIWANVGKRINEQRLRGKLKGRFSRVELKKIKSVQEDY